MLCWPFRHKFFYQAARDVENGEGDFQVKRTRLKTFADHYKEQKDKLNGWNKAGSKRVLTMSTTFVGLTCIGLVPALVGMQQFIVDQDTTTWMLWLLAGLGTTYLFWYFAAHIMILIVATRYVRIIEGAGPTLQVINEVDTYSAYDRVHVDRVDTAIKYLNRTILPALDRIASLVRLGTKVIYFVHCLEWILQATVFCLSVAVIIQFFRSTKTDEYEQAGRNQLAYAVWLFAVNIISSLLVKLSSSISNKIE